MRIYQGFSHYLEVTMVFQYQSARMAFLLVGYKEKSKHLADNQIKADAIGKKAVQAVGSQRIVTHRLSRLHNLSIST